ncbi:MAG: tRNA pseudouridine(13) synthase TruD [Myxococcota bacterium]
MFRLRAQPEDFRVDEVPLYPPSGAGEHTFVQVRKRLRTTEEVARDLARAAGGRARDVGYAGRKDRVAVATQWFSVPGLDPERALSLTLPCAEVLEAVRHPHKLRTGQLRGNRFRVVARDVDAAHLVDLDARLAALVRVGMPNRFGPQRFGRTGENVEKASRLLRGEPTGRDRRAARFLLSALQAAVFNRVLATRPLPLDGLERGEVATLHASGGCFVVEDVAAEAPRAASFEISATGPIFGSRSLAPRFAAAERERRALEEFGVDPDDLRPPRGIRMRGARRPVRVRPGDAAVEEIDGAVVLRFSLPPGSYATVLVEELLGGEERTPTDG